MIDNQAFIADVKKLVDSVTGDCYVGLEEEESLADRLNKALKEMRAPVVDERAVRIPVPFSVDTTHKNQAFVTLGFYDEGLRKEFVRAVCSGGFRVPTAALASAPVAEGK